MQAKPNVLLVVRDEDIVRRWTAALADTAEVRVARTFEEARQLTAEPAPDLCAVDIALTTSGQAHARPLVVALRGLCLSAEFIALGAQPRIEALVTSVNEGQVRRFVTFEASAEEIRACVEQVWGAASTTRALRARLRELGRQRDQLLVERDNLTTLLQKSNVQLADAAESQEELRTQLDGLMRESLPANVQAFADFKQRIRDELERNRRYAHPVCLIRVELQYKASANAVERLCRDLLALATDTLRIIDVVSARTNEEVWVLLPVTQRPQAEIAARRLSVAIAQSALPVVLGKIAVSAYPEDAAVFESGL